MTGAVTSGEAAGPHDVHVKPGAGRLVARIADTSRSALVCGIVNVTPDSFADGGRYHDRSAAVVHALRMAEQGADILDIGGESTRPGSRPPSVAEEIDRVA